MANEISCPYCSEPMPTRVDWTTCPNGHEFVFNYPALVDNAIRELQQRERVYPRLIAKGAMTSAEAEHLKALQAQTIAVLRAFNATRDELAEFLRQKRGAAPAVPPHHDPLTEVIR